MPTVRISRGLPWPSWPESTANNHKVRGSSLRNASMCLSDTQNSSCLSRGSHSSAGQSVRLITVRSAVQARVGPSDPKPGQRDGRTVGPLKSKSGPLWHLQRWASCPLWGLESPFSLGTVVAVSWATDVRVRACGFCSSLAFQMLERCRGAKFLSRSHSSAG